LGPLTALVGPNGSGKSNIGDALRFLSECLRDGLDAAISRRNGIGSLSRWSSGRPFDLAVSVSIENERGDGFWAFQLAQEAGGAYYVKAEIAVWSPVDKPGVQYRFQLAEGQWVQRPESLDPAVERTALALPLIAGDSPFHELATELKNVAIYQIFPDKLREPQKPNPARPMLEHGENWASILKAMGASTWKPDLLAALARIVGDIALPGRRGPAPSGVRDVVPALRPADGGQAPRLRPLERPGLQEGTSFSGDVESIRGVKEWLSKHFAGGKAYKPTLDQLPMTQMIDLPTLRAANVPSFGTFERSLRFLSTAGPGDVYPPPRPLAG